MTGFGRGEYLDQNYRFIIELKAVNHRYQEVSIRAPKFLAGLEDRIRRALSQVIARGRVDVFVTVEEFGERGRSVRLDRELAQAYDKAFRELGELLNHSDQNYYLAISRMPDVFKVTESPRNEETLWPTLEKALLEALEALVKMRKTEGANICRDLIARQEILKKTVIQIQERAPQVVEDYQKNLTQKIRHLMESVASQPDENRLLQEVAIFADRVSITEELVRLDSHLDQLKQTLCSEGSMGRKLDFLMQEINRECNTIAAKANDYMLASLVVTLKSEIEKIREQVQNIE